MRVLLAAIAAILMALSIWQLEQDRSGLTIRPLEGTGTTPASLYLRDTDAKAPVVVIAHGFAGSRQLMEPFALTLAQAGYLVASFDFEGHGRNPVPMSGDVTSPDGTTRLLMAETARVARAALAHPRADGRLAYLGHSMASDIVIRQALSDPPGDAVVAVSMFSQAVTGAEPVNLLAVSGAWETRLVQESLRVLRLTDPEAQLGQTTGDPAQGTGRRAVAAPMVEHVGVLYSQTALAEARDWLDAAFGRSSDGPVPARGGWIALLLVATAALGWPMARSLPRARMACPQPGRRGFWLAALVPALVTPLLLAPFDLRFLPVLVADYLAVHLAVYGAITLVFCWRLGLLRGQFPARAFWVAGAVAVFGIAVFWRRSGPLCRVFRAACRACARGRRIGAWRGALPVGRCDSQRRWPRPCLARVGAARGVSCVIGVGGRARFRGPVLSGYHPAGDRAVLLAIWHDGRMGRPAHRPACGRRYWPWPGFWRGRSVSASRCSTPSSPGFLVRVEGLEPPRLAAPEPKSGASTNFATPACAAL